MSAFCAAHLSAPVAIVGGARNSARPTSCSRHELIGRISIARRRALSSILIVGRANGPSYRTTPECYLGPTAAPNERQFRPSPVASILPQRRPRLTRARDNETRAATAKRLPLLPGAIGGNLKFKYRTNLQVSRALVCVRREGDAIGAANRPSISSARPLVRLSAAPPPGPDDQRAARGFSQGGRPREISITHTVARRRRFARHPPGPQSFGGPIS